VVLPKEGLFVAEKGGTIMRRVGFRKLQREKGPTRSRRTDSMSRKAVPLGGSRDPVKTSFKGRATLAHALSRDVPVQRTLATLHKAEGIVSIYARWARPVHACEHRINHVHAVLLSEVTPLTVTIPTSSSPRPKRASRGSSGALGAGWRIPCLRGRCRLSPSCARAFSLHAAAR